MTEGRPWVSILYFVLPILFGLLLQQLYNTVDTIVVGNFSGEQALSAVGTTGSLTFLALAFATGFSSGNGIVISQFFGAGKDKEVRENASVGLILLLGMGILVTVLGILFSRFFFERLLDVPEEILSQTLLYFNVYMLGMIFQFGYNAIAAILRAVGDSAATLYFLLIASVINIILDIWFVASFRMGVFGAALATDISQALSLIAALVYMSVKYPVFRFKLKEYTWNTKQALMTLRTGFPIALQLVIVSTGLTFIQKAVNGFGQAMIASATVGQRIEMYMNLPCNAFQTTLATFTGQNIGAGKMERVRKGAHQGLILSLLFTLIISFFVYTFAPQIGSFFGLSSLSAEYSVKHLETVALINILLAAYIPLFGVFQGANHTAFPAVVATVALSVRVLVTYLFRYSTFFGLSIIWWNGLFGFGCGFIVTWSYYLSGLWKKNAALTES